MIKMGAKNVGKMPLHVDEADVPTMKRKDTEK